MSLSRQMVRAGAVLGISMMLVCGSAQAQETGEREPWGVTADVSVASKYLSHGFNLGGDSWSFQPSLTLQTRVPGLDFQVWSAIPFDRDYSQQDEIDFIAHYRRDLFPEKKWVTHFHAMADYWIFTRQTNEETGRQFRGIKYKAGVSFPHLVPLFGAYIVPEYNYFYWQAIDTDAFEEDGAHEFFLRYGIPMAKFMPAQEGQTFSLGTSVTYHQGAFGNESGWSHCTVHAATSMVFGPVTFTPAVNYQWSFEDTINEDDEFWASFSMTTTF